MPLYASYGSMSSFIQCRRYYWYKHIRRLERAVLKIPFVVGRIVHHGIQTLFKSYPKVEVAEKEIRKKYKEESKKARKEFAISAEDDQELAQTEYVTSGMLKAYSIHHAAFLKNSKHVATEKSLIYQLSDKVTIVAKLDNIIENKEKLYDYELKTTKGIDMQKIKSIKTDPQTSLGFALHNLLEKKKLSGIIYDIIKKPQIRQKKNESKKEFNSRLLNWYADNESLKFHIERIEKPLISVESVMNTAEKVTSEMLRTKTKEDYYQNFKYCIHEWGPCPYYPLCHEGGETPANLKLYRSRPKYQVTKDTEDV